LTGIVAFDANDWGEVYIRKDLDMDKAQKLLAMYSRRHEGKLAIFSDLELPGGAQFAKILTKLTDSATGINGIPYSAYKAVLQISAEVFASTVQDFAQADRPPELEAFNRQVVWFALKQVFTDDNRAAYRLPNQLRTIFGSNCDCKILSHGLAHSITLGCLALTPQMQRGFCRGRQLATNVVDLDAFGRVFNEKYPGPWSPQDVHNFPVMALYDFCNAFPTIIHEWLFLVLRTIGLPTPFLQAFKWLYTDVSAYSSGIGDNTYLFPVLGGVKTGCPASSILFPLGLNPIVDLFTMLCEGPRLSITRICADDFGSCLSALSHIKTHDSFFTWLPRWRGYT